MHETVRFLAQYDYWLLLGAILGRQACLPVPANLVVVAAGALARSERLTPAAIVGLSVAAFLCADLAWYKAGRKFGGRILHFACSLTRDSVSCTYKANSAFARHGVRILLVSKFIPGLDAVAAPLAGQAHVSVIRFLVFDGLGAAFWTGTYAALGYLFANQLDLVALHVARVGTFLVLAVAAGLICYTLGRLARWHGFVRRLHLARITAGKATVSEPRS